MTSSVVYWIRLPEHNDVFTQGYVGVSSNQKKRFYDHRYSLDNSHLRRAVEKYGWDSLIKQVLLIADKTYCLMIEAKLRAQNHIGWNIVKGGGAPPESKWNLGKTLSEETKAKISLSRKGKKHTPEMQARLNLNLLAGAANRFVNGQTPWNKGLPPLPHVVEAVRRATTGRVHSEEEKEKRAAKLRGRKRPQHVIDAVRRALLGKPGRMLGKHYKKITCPHCGKEGGASAMPRWHFNNCKLKGN